MGFSLSLIYGTIFGPIVAVILWFIVAVIRYLTTDAKDEYLKKQRKDHIITAGMCLGIVVGVIIVIILLILLIGHTS